MKIVVFEDDKFDLLYPLSMMRAVYDVKPGAFSILEKISAASGKTAKNISLHCRRSLAPLMKSQTDLPVNEFGKDDYSFNIVNLPHDEIDNEYEAEEINEETPSKTEKKSKTKKQADDENQSTLF